MHPPQQAQQQTAAALEAMQLTVQQTSAAVQALQVQQLALQQAQQAMQQTATALQASVLRVEVIAAKAYNSSCRNGRMRPFVPVPDAAGAPAPAGAAPLRSFDDIRALTDAQLLTWCAHLGVPTATATTLNERRQLIAGALGALPLAGELGELE